MYIKELIIDGFKSYAQRTSVSGFDRHFNAITGLNGSGKSNILDAICFVLGISQLQQVRVSNLQELVYKQGQAGVIRASVTIIFDNSDARLSPVGYDQYKELTITRQVMLGGKNKYLINGHTAQVSQVQNLFHSVQLNVNNPHFLIMQGRITKVKNLFSTKSTFCVSVYISETSVLFIVETNVKGREGVMNSNLSPISIPFFTPCRS
jgi:structural maintenance of chromosome 2